MNVEYQEGSQKEYQATMHRAVDLLARREHSQLELTNKLQKKGFAEGVVHNVLAELQANNLQSDDRFAEAFVNERVRRGYGPIKIRYELNQKGISEQLIESYIYLNSHQWSELAQIQYQKKYRNMPVNDYKEWSKRARFLQSRGFSSEHIRASIQFDADID